jgi:hypothetical protein
MPSEKAPEGVGMDKEPESSEIEGRVGVSRRRFVHRFVVGSAFTIPVVSSVNLNSLASPRAIAANQTSP